MTVMELAGPQCKDIIVCPQARDDRHPLEVGASDAGGITAAAAGEEGSRSLSLECALLVLEAIEDSGGCWEMCAGKLLVACGTVRQHLGRRAVAFSPLSVRRLVMLEATQGACTFDASVDVQYMSSAVVVLIHFGNMLN